jgi:hypothetical protein
MKSRAAIKKDSAKCIPAPKPSMPNGGCTMTLELLNKAQLQIINPRGLQYPLDAAEKDYFLALVVRKSSDLSAAFSPASIFWILNLTEN